MIIYESTKEQFVGHVVNELLIDRLYSSYQKKIGRTSKAEICSRENSLQKMSNVMQDEDTPRDATVAIEFNIPNTSKRVDFLIASNENVSDIGTDYDFRIFDDPNEMMEEVEKLNERNNKSRLIGGILLGVAGIKSARCEPSRYYETRA